MMRPEARSLRLPFLLVLAFLSGCGRAPSFNILGSFFPAWLICMFVGVLAAVLVYWVFARKEWDKHIPWAIMVYPCFAAFIAFTTWLIFFG